MKRARAGRQDEVEGLDEEFLFHLNRGSELLTRGEAEAARAALERALELRPKDAKVLGLLGQAYYKLGKFEGAAEVWQRLVDDNPVEAGARVNLGLANLKAKRHSQAVKQLEIALDLNPEHKKAMGYLGLALLESGQAARARELFRRAGSDQLVARCDEILAGGAVRGSPTPPPEGDVGPEPPPAPEPIRTPPPGEVAVYGFRPSTAGQPALAAWASERLVRPASAETFSIAGDTLAVSVRGEVRVRTDGLFASRGKLDVTGEVKRFRGRATDKPFGEGAARMHRVSGEGVLFYRAVGRRYTALDLAGEAGYFREEVVFGLEEPVVFENGRVPSHASAELNLVHLRGRGRFLIVTRGEASAVDVSPDQPVRVPLDALVGWVGNLTPRVTTLSDADEDGPAAVELTGDGRVLADTGADARGS
ncbi:MAG TPA: tetratricopeptide repeat protein [Anaeromyxobacteraceae bacterium]|nr:tetratricopeptide repeat protein [Anaeromyxobacteraceae bacterium]